MNHWQKLGLPVALGICAAYLNWQSVSRKLEPRDYVAAKENIAPGTILTQDSFHRVSISHTAQVGLENTLVPWSQVDTLKSRFAQRTILAKSPLTQFDICEANVSEKLDNEDEFEVKMTVGEKENRLIFVNDRVNTRSESGDELNGCRVLSVARNKDDYSIRLAVNVVIKREFTTLGNSIEGLKIYGQYLEEK